MTKTREELIRCVGRELGMRRAAYPKWVKSGRMKQEDADHEIACMDELYKMLKEQQAQG
jgi:hypothetical protein